jgi:hypothetical protein
VNIPDPCRLLPSEEQEYFVMQGYVSKPTYPLGSRCHECGHLWSVHTRHSMVINGALLDTGCTQCQSERLMLEALLDEISHALGDGKI